MNERKLSIVIPVHNGEKYIAKTVSGLLKQSYSHFEIVLVENHSTDRSYEKCISVAGKDKRIRVLKCNEKGTSLARKMGVENAAGEYLLFADQDDRFINRFALEKIVNAIEEDGTDICQFSYYKEYAFFLRKRVSKTREKVILSAEEMLGSELRGVLGVYGGYFDTTVWSKIYRTELLQEAVTHIHETLYYAEDEYLNAWAFTSPLLKSVSVRNEAYYCWKSNTGFSARQNGEALLKDYETVKPVVTEMALAHCGDEHTLWIIYGESLFCMRSVIFEMIHNDCDKAYITQKIIEYNQMDYLMKAKEYFRNYPDQSKVWDSLKVMSSDYTAEEFYDYCCRELPDTSLKGKIKTFSSKLFR